MPTLEESVIKLISLSEQGRFIEALRAFYAEDAVMQENNEPPRAGLANVLERERKVMAVFKEAHVNRADSFVSNGDRAAINWIYEYTDQRAPQASARRIGISTMARRPNHLRTILLRSRTDANRDYHLRTCVSGDRRRSHPGVAENLRQ